MTEDDYQSRKIPVLTQGRPSIYESSGRYWRIWHRFSWKFDDTMFTQNGEMAVIPEIQKLLEPSGARAHWGKLFTGEREYHACIYPRFKDFVALARKLDANGKLRNAFLTADVYGS